MYDSYGECFSKNVITLLITVLLWVVIIAIVAAVVTRCAG